MGPRAPLIFHEDAPGVWAEGSTTTKTSAPERVLHLHEEPVGLEAPTDILDITHIVVVDHEEIGAGVKVRRSRKFVPMDAETCRIARIGYKLIGG